MSSQVDRRQFLATSAAAALTAGFAPAVRAAAPDFLTIGGGPSGGVFNIVATGLADILRSAYPDTIIDVQPGGSGPNLLRVGSGKADIGITSASNAVNAWNGKDPATPENPVTNTRGLMTIMQSAIQIWVPANSDIQSVDDLRGKQVSAGQPGQTSWLAFENLLNAAGMSMDDIASDGGKMHKLSWAESHDALRNRQLDAVMWLSLWPHPTVLQDETVRPLRAISIDDDVIENFLKSSGGGFEKVTLPKGLFEGQDKPANTVGTATFLFASTDMADNIAHDIVKKIWENKEAFMQIHSLLDNMSKDSIGKGMVVPLHPGAKAYYDEEGIPYAESELG